jgi:tRNA A-37 threonylcarbamoyl transferase component Bud32
VRPRLSDTLALKFVPNIPDSVVQLEEEHRILLDHASGCGCSLIASVSPTFAITEESCGFLLNEVGTTCSRELIFKTKKPTLNEVLMSLHALHTHRPNPIFHGDARLPNLIVVDDRLVWIDLMRCSNREKDSDYRFSADMHTLVQSLFPSMKTRDDQTLRQLIDSYSANRSPLSITELEEYLLTNLTTATGQLKG